jgi:carboxyl-terminal processing protease
MDYPRTPDEVRERWRKKIKFELLQQRLEKKPLPEAEQKEKVLRRHRYLLHRWADQTTSDEILEIYLNALTTSFDPHTNYMSPSTLEDFNIQMRLHLDGIGAKLRWEDGYTIVAEILPGGTADLDGRLHVDDKIVGVAADGQTIVDVVDMRLQDVVKKIRGPRDTEVALRVMPAGKTETVEYKLKRAKIELKNQEARGEIVEFGSKPDGSPLRVGYIQLPSFYYDISAAANGEENVKSCKDDVKKILADFKADPKGVDAVILDLRSNGGGALQEAIELTGLFIDKGPVVKVKTRLKRVDTHNDKDSDIAYDGPLMVLVNKLSASASEILAGAIQDYGRGLVVGDSSTHGKGTVQTVVDVGRPTFGSRGSALGALKLTIQQFYRINGDSTQNRGVIPDITLPSIADHVAIAESDLPQAVPFGQVQPSEYTNLGLVNGDLKTQLIALSEKRRGESSEFQKLNDDINRTEELKQRKGIALSEARRREEMKRGAKSDDALDELEDELDKPKKKDAPAFERNFYNNEVLSIMEDYLRLGKNPRVARSQ